VVAEFSFFYTKRSSMTYSFKQFVQNFMFRFLGSRVSSRFQENGTYAIGLTRNESWNTLSEVCERKYSHYQTLYLTFPA